MRTLVIATGLVLSLGCATPYQEKGFTGGYSEQYLGDDVYLITIRVNAYTDQATAYEYFHRRAKEITEQNGYKRYEVLDSSGSQKTGVVMSGTTPIVITKNQVYGRIKCFRE